MYTDKYPVVWGDGEVSRWKSVIIGREEIFLRGMDSDVPPAKRDPRDFFSGAHKSRDEGETLIWVGFHVP